MSQNSRLLDLHRHCLWSVAGIVASLLWAGFAVTPSRASDFLTSSQVTRLGLTQAWQRQTELPAGSQSIVAQKLHVQVESPHEYVELVRVDDSATAENEGEADSQNTDLPKKEREVLLRIPTDRVDSFGKPIGKTEAERLAKNQLRILKRRGIEATLEYRTVPRIVLYTLGDDGTVECRDAESGEPVWMVRVGNRRFGYIGIGVGEEYVTIINGGNMIELDAANGEMVEQRPTVNTPMYGSIQAGDFSIFVTIRNGIEAYPLYDPTLLPFRETVSGRALALPVKGPGSTRIAWATDRGFVYCMEAGGSEPLVLFRLDTDGIVSGRIAAASGKRFFFGSEAGQVYGILANRSGQVTWSRPYGEPFFEEPVVAGTQVLIRSTYGNLFSLDAETGYQTWETSTPGIDQLLGVIEGKVYATTLSGSMTVLDLESGKRIETLAGVRPDRVLRNVVTDRLYLVGKSGTVQCLRSAAAANELPTIGEGFDQEPIAEEEQAEEKPEEKKEEEQDFNPAGGADPFGGPGADPFGGPGSDPFGGSGGGNDPFGSDPFGGS